MKIITREEMLKQIKERVISGDLTRDFEQIIIYGLDDNTDLNSFELKLNIFINLSQKDKRIRSGRVKWGMRQQFMKSGFVGGTVPLGYIYNKESSEIEVDCHSAMLISLIYKLYLEGYGATSIAKKLDERDLNTPAEYKQAHQQSIDINMYPKTKRWSVSSVYNILTNPIYIGTLMYGRYSGGGRVAVNDKEIIIIDRPHLSIVSKKVFDRVQYILKQRKAKARVA